MSDAAGMLETSCIDGLGVCYSDERQHVQGRFSGRLETKDDERLLAEECKLLGPLLGGSGKRGERARTTLAKIVRGIAAGDIRQHLEEQQRDLQVLLCSPAAAKLT